MNDSVTVAPEHQNIREDYPAMLSAKQAASILNCSPRSITRMCEAGKIKAVKVVSMWRVNRDALMEYAGLA